MCSSGCVLKPGGVFGVSERMVEGTIAANYEPILVRFNELYHAWAKQLFSLHGPPRAARMFSWSRHFRSHPLRCARRRPGWRSRRTPRVARANAVLAEQGAGDNFGVCLRVDLGQGERWHRPGRLT
jgi:hypothetical protein